MLCPDVRNMSIGAMGLIFAPVVAVEGAGAGIFSLGTVSLKSFATRAGVNALSQFGGSYLATGNASESASNVNFAQVGLAGLGMNYVGAGLLSSAVNYNPLKEEGRRFTSLGNGISVSNFATNTAVNIGFGYLGGRAESASLLKYKNMAVGAYMRSSLTFGQNAGSALGNGIATAGKAIGAGKAFGVDVLGNAVGTKLSQ